MHSNTATRRPNLARALQLLEKRELSKMNDPLPSPLPPVEIFLRSASENSAEPTPRPPMTMELVKREMCDDGVQVGVTSATHEVQTATSLPATPTTDSIATPPQKGLKPSATRAAQKSSFSKMMSL